MLSWVCAGCRSFEEVRRADWLGLLQGKLTSSQVQAIEREAPERLQVPSGSRLALTYEPGRPPVLAVRIQEVFGWKDTPRVAGGRVRVLLHLLAPNHRPQQVTDDLASFWNNTYQQVRKELRIRYPKHAWPEDPWNAPAESKPKRR
jgi:ATP-dependent helicase HrpB